MADIWEGHGDLRMKRIDLGDGTYAEAVSNVAGASSTPQTVTPAPSTIATRTSVAASATVVTLLAANTSRKFATVFNHSTALLFVALGSAGSATSFTVEMTADSYYEVPGNYTGIITGLWASATGSARVTELT